MAEDHSAERAADDAERKLHAAIAERDAWEQEAFEAKRFAASLDVARQAFADRLATADARATEAARPEIDAALAARDQAVRERDGAWAERDRARAAEQDAEAMLRRVLGSTSWRLTAPLRLVLMRVLGRAPE